MRSHLVRTLLTDAAATAIVVLTAGQAFAASAVITITGAGTKFQAMSQSVVLSDAATGLNVHCANSVIGGSLANVANAPLPYATTQAGGAAHSITGLSLSGCGSAVPAGYLPDDFVFTNTSSTAPQAIGVVVPSLPCSTSPRSAAASTRPARHASR